MAKIGLVREFGVIRVLFRHDGACPRRALTDRLERRLPTSPVSASRPPPSAADATRKRKTGWRVVLACQSALHRDEPGGGEAEINKNNHERSLMLGILGVVSLVLGGFTAGAARSIGSFSSPTAIANTDGCGQSDVRALAGC